MEKEEKKDIKYSRKIIISLVVIILIVFTVISISFVTYVKLEQISKPNDNIQSNVSMTYTENSNGISIMDATPISDDVGKTLSSEDSYFDFTVSTKIAENTPINYEIVAIKDKSSTIEDKDIKLYLEKQVSGTYEEILEPKAFTPITKESIIGAPKGSMVLKKIVKNKSQFDNYRLRMWINEDSNIQDNKTYTIKINVYGKIV